MPPVPPELTAAAHPNLLLTFHAALALYALALAVTLVRPAWGRFVVAAGASVHLFGTAWRGQLIGYFPLTNKMESFSAAALALALVTVVAWRPARRFAAPLIVLTGVALVAALRMGFDLRYPVPPLRTVWYPIHVPLSFLAYASWAAAAAAGGAWLRGREPSWLRACEHLGLVGFGLWSLSMIAGGIWGVVAWGAYFLWDPKVIWSVILWFHYAAFIHVRLTPSLRGRPWVIPALAWLGLLWVLIAYVGTSFFFGKNSHAF